MPSLALVVENDESTRKLLDVVLTRNGYEVDGVVNGIDALVLLGAIDYDMIVLDLFVPGASGAEVLSWLQSRRAGAVERTVVVSSAPKKYLEEIQERFPSARVLRKPFELHELIEAANAAHRDRAEVFVSATDRFARRSIVAGAKAGLIVRKRGGEISLVHEFGYPAHLVKQWFPLSADSALPLCTCVREGRSQWLASTAAVAPQFPHLASVWQTNQSRALATVPLIRDETVVGAAGWSFREPRAFDEREQREFTAIALDAAAVLESTQPGELAGA